MVDWLTLAVSIVLPVSMAIVGWIVTRIVGRIDALETRVGSMDTTAAERDSKQDARIDTLERTSLTREDLRDVIETALAKSTAPITLELKAISVEGQKTRERLVRLEATLEARGKQD